MGWVWSVGCIFRRGKGIFEEVIYMDVGGGQHKGGLICDLYF